MFKGYTGYIQADAKSVYDILFTKPPDITDKDDRPDEVGCWAHARRKLYEAAIAKSKVAREALFRIGRMFAYERK